MAGLNTIKNWFKTGHKPTQQQFWDTWDSFFHKDDKVPISSIDGLNDRFDEKADQEAFDNHKTDHNAHNLAELLDEKANAVDVTVALETKADQSDLEIVQAELAGKADLPDELVIGGVTTVDGNDVTVAAATWRISGLIYLTEIPTPFNDIANSSEGNQRYVAFYGDTADDIIKVEGVEANIAVLPVLPDNTALISCVLVGDAGIGEPILDTSGFALKADLGDKAGLITDDRLTVVGAVNEVKGTLNSIESDQITLKIFKISNYATP